MKSFNIPDFYRSPIISRIKNLRKSEDPKRAINTPTILDFGPVTVLIARHFGFCYGVENAVEISFRAVDENPDKRVFLLSQMIHNPEVNQDLVSRGVKFLMDPSGKQLIPWEELKSDDIVIIPAFGTTLEIEAKLRALGIEPQKYNTTCPFVERVWKKSTQLSKDRHTIILHGKPNHEETRATFSHSAEHSPVIVVKDIHESRILGEYILGKRTEEEFRTWFTDRVSNGFDTEQHLQKVGVINQTTMLATETQEIADYFKSVMEEKFGKDNIRLHFADTRDTLCYATNQNQDATYGLLEQEADIAIVVGGYNSSNTTHLVELCETKFPTYFIKDDSEILSSDEIRHFDIHAHELKTAKNWLPGKGAKVIITSGASCPDSIVDRVMQKVLGYYEGAYAAEDVISRLEAEISTR